MVSSEWQCFQEFLLVDDGRIFFFIRVKIAATARSPAWTVYADQWQVGGNHNSDGNWSRAVTHDLKFIYTTFKRNFCPKNKSRREAIRHACADAGFPPRCRIFSLTSWVFYASLVLTRGVACDLATSHFIRVYLWKRQNLSGRGGINSHKSTFIYTSTNKINQIIDLIMAGSVTNFSFAALWKVDYFVKYWNTKKITL